MTDEEISYAPWFDDKDHVVIEGLIENAQREIAQQMRSMDFNTWLRIHKGERVKMTIEIKRHERISTS